MSSRNRPIRHKIASVLLLPVLGVLALSALAAARVFAQPSALVEIAAAALGLLVAVGSVMIAVRVTDHMAGDARALTAGLYDFSNRRLPVIADRVRKDFDTHGGQEAPEYRFTTREMEESYDAFVVARDAAVEAAADEAMLRKGIGEVFVNLARRSQALIHRQLNLLDVMERRASDPDELDDLFRLDHLATRMRRHAEGLVILSGTQPSRAWRNPVPFVDVVRGAVAEVEDYPRVTVPPMPGASLSGRAVADVIHLLAELIENAAVFSPPHTSVQVTGQPVANGFAIEIEDRGLGLAADQLAAVNNLLANPPEFDLSESARLGLFVVGRLAKRHDIRVSLRPSPYGGTTAIVLVPSALVVEGDGTGRRSPTYPGADEVTAPAAGAPAKEGADYSAGTANYPAGTADYSAGTADAAGQPASESTTEPATTAGPEPETPPGPAPPAEDAEPSTAGAAEDDSGGAELPRRVRQANLAPELRETPSPDPEPADEPAPERSPEDVRATMAALQTGWLRGRSEDATEASTLPHRTVRPAPRTAPGEDAR